MDDERLTLRDVAQRAVDRNGGKGGRALDREAKRAGLTLSYTTVDKILTGTYRSTPKRATLEALAHLAGLPLETVYEAADLPVPQRAFAEQLPDGVDSLTPHQREAVLAVVRQLVDANRMLRQARNVLVHGTDRGQATAELALHNFEMEHGGEPAIADFSEGLGARRRRLIEQGQPQTQAAYDQSGEEGDDADE